MANSGQGSSHATPEQLALLAPLAALSADRLQELAGLTPLERVARGTDPLSGRAAPGKSLFLVKGELLLRFARGGTSVLVGGSPEARRPINPPPAGDLRAKAITDAELLEIDNDTLDVLMTWDEVAAAGMQGGKERANALRSDARLVSSVFSLDRLRGGLFSRMPAAHIDELFARFHLVEVAAGTVVIREGDEGDYYYVIESGRCRVDRVVGGTRVTLAELKSGDAFGEEALVSEAKRNATVTAVSHCRLLRLDKRDFNALLREPLLRRVGFAEAGERVRAEALWLDVRYPSEYLYDKLPGAINVPLSEIRNVFALLDRSKRYIVYCQSGRRSAAAAFLLAQQGFDVQWLDGGLWACGAAQPGTPRA